MKKIFNVINLPEPLPEIHPIKVKFEDQDILYDFSIYGDTEIARLLAKVFLTQNSHLTKHTRGRAYQATKKFLKFLADNNLKKVIEINPQYLASYAHYLDIQNLSISTKYSTYNQIELMLTSAKKLPNKTILNFNIPSNPFRDIKKDRPTPKKITTENLKTILKICYEKIDFILADFRKTKEINSQLKDFFDNGGQFNKHDRNHIVYYFYKKYGYAPIAEKLEYEEKQLIRGLGNFSLLDNVLTPNVHALLPFYLVLVIELAGNSDAIRQINIDCIEEDPLFKDRASIVWNKNRATDIQKRNVLKNKKYGAYKIVEWVKEITENTRKQVDIEEKDFLFLSKAGQGKKLFGFVKDTVFKNACKMFCKENNLDFSFNPSEIRPTVLTEMYKKNKDVVAISKIANHKNIETTLLYIVDEETKKLNRASLSSAQDNMIEKIMKKKPIKNLIEINKAKNIGFICENPIIDNKLCINWMNELTNPNLIIPENEKYLSKIIALKNEIIKVKEMINQERYKLLYEPTLLLIEEQILPKFNKKIIILATELSKKVKMPSLGEM
jgi:site-specific recombinase XerD